MEDNKISDDVELIRKFRSGDRKSLEEIIKKYERTIYSFSFKVCRDKDKAENTMQETFLSMIKNIDQFDGKSKLSTWLYTIVSNHCMMLARSNKKHAAASLDDEELKSMIGPVDEESTDPGEIAENNELKSFLDDAVQKLPVKYKLVFLLSDAEGLSNEEISQITGISVAAVKSRLHRARTALRSELSKSLKESEK
jgi:RNA polymerase sigma-70 factor (ECF subfamily)